ncbi:Sec23-binding domain of Sec16-domain-containing protein [Astrocystis sublimbata]|nr:Sec23-binding domain of Sec16-domain-containing protein [Astrocystis sublimbata]
MASDTPSSAWHPAKRPNSLAGDASFQNNNSAINESHQHVATGSPSEHAPSAEDLASQPPNQPVESNSDEDSEEPATASWAAEASAQTPVANQDARSILYDDIEEHDIEDPPAPAPAPAPASKHLSTMSFARTVSHEVSFADDDDAEWNFERSETDPFGFMPETERTNSFPVVPQAQSPLAEQYSHHPPTSQAEEILQELETESPQVETTASGLQDAGLLEAERAIAHREDDGHPQNAMGGEMVGAEEEASDARYEEGLPLIPQHHLPNAAAEVKNMGADPVDFFSQDETADAGDDFFAQIHDDPGTSPAGPQDYSLQRKSTTMVIGQNTGLAPSDLTADVHPGTPAQNPTSVNGDSVYSPEGGAKIATGTDDIDAKWAAAFGDDDDDDGGFLLDTTTESKELDPADIFGSDDEGFLEDEEVPTPAAAPPSQTQPAHPNPNGRYTPGAVQPQSHTSPNPYRPASIAQQQPLYASGIAPPATGFGSPPPRPDIPKAQSFAAKSKGGYQSPYDLPMEVVKPPKRRTSVQPLPRGNVASPAPPSNLPPRNASMYAQPPPSGGSVSSLSPPSSSHSNQQSSLGALKPAPQLKSKSSSFFEDLPVASRPRPSSRQAIHPSPTLPDLHGQPKPPPQVPSLSTPLMPPPAASPTTQSHLSPTRDPSVAGLVAPERVSPYAVLQADAPSRSQPPSTVGSRYSPAGQSPGANGMVPATTSTSRYSPAPPNSRSSSGSYSAVPPPILPHQPRTSSPLAHFEVSHGKAENKLASPVNGDGVPLLRTGSSQYDHRVTRVPSLPPTQEVEEEQMLESSPNMAAKGLGISMEPKYPPARVGHTPPPLGIHPSNPLSPPKRSLSNYTPQPVPPHPSSRETGFVPPLRSQTQSPGAVHGNRGLANPSESAPRPSSAHAPTSPPSEINVQNPVPTVRARGMSQTLNLVLPTDGRELDPLQRWRGAPCIAWGVGGLLATSFPQNIPRYGITSNIPQITRSPGEVKLQHFKDVQPLEDRLSKFPGPLKGKSRKKEVSAWLTAGIDGLEKRLPSVSFQTHVAHEDKREIERVLLWKILRVLVDNDGVLEGNTTVEKAVRDVISPGLETDRPEFSSAVSASVDLTGMTTATGMQIDASDPTVAESIRRHLLLGDREKAVWAAADKRLWGHAILIASSSPNAELYRQVAQEFIKKEVNHAGQGHESLASLYSVLSGNFDEAVDELVPAHARAGLQLMSTSASATSQDVLAGLDKWRETLGLILSNRRQGDGQALRSLGNLLSEYGRAEAAHICFIFAKQFAIFGGMDDPLSNFVLVGADHRRQIDQFAKETEALQLSEVYEFGLSLASGSNVPQSCPHLAAYKLQHAIVLAEHGCRDKAIQYCEAIWSAITSQTKKSPYFNPVLESAVDDIMTRLKQAAGDESSSWITKPKMDQVSSNMWSRFSKFVAGPDDGTDNGGSGEGGAELGPFARIAGGTPTVSRSPSVSNFEVYGTSPSMPANMAPSAYTPNAGHSLGSPYEPTAYTPASRSSMERTSGELRRTSHDFARRGSDVPSASTNPYAPVSMSSLSPKNPYQPTSPLNASPYMPISQNQSLAPMAKQPSDVGYPGYQPPSGDRDSGGAGIAPDTIPHDQAPASDLDFNSANSAYQPSYGSYEPPSMGSFEPHTAQADTSIHGYEAPSYQPSSFEPPSYEAGPIDDDGFENRPKLKSFMDDDDDRTLSNSKLQEKSKSEKDRENEEMFRKVAEEEAKRAAEAKAGKKGGWGFSGWFGGGKKESTELPNKPIKAKLGEASSFSGAENTPAKTATPPPPRAASTPPTASTSTPPIGITAPPLSRNTPPPMTLKNAISTESLNAPGGAPLMARSVSNQSNASLPGGAPSAPPSRPATSLSNASSIDDLLGAAGPRKGPKKPRKGGRYVDVMAK